MPLDAVMPAFVIAGLGYIVGKRLNLDKTTLSRICLYALVPALTFNSLVTSHVDFQVTWRLALAAVLLPLLQSALYFAVFRRLKWDSNLVRAMLLVTVFSNAGNLGLPICLFAFGPEGMELAVVFMVAQTVVMATLGTFIAASGSAGPDGPMSRVAKMPAVYAALLGLIVRISGFPVPSLIERPVSLLAGACVPVFLLLLGVQLVGNNATATSWTKIIVAAALRLVISPALAYFLGMGLGLTGLALKILVLENAMPSAVNATILAEEFDADPQSASRATFGNTIAGLVTIPLWIALLGIL